MPPEADRVRLRRIGAAILPWVLAAGITGAVAEAVCRLLDPLGISYYPETAAYLDTLVIERDGYRNRPGLRGTFYGADVRINPLGLRERDLPRTPAPGEVRVLVMGDSFPFGIGVPEEEAIPRRLEEALQAAVPTGRTVRTVNLGVVSYNSEQQLRQLESVGLAMRPSLVVVLYALNDIEPVWWVFDKRRAWPVDLAQRSYAASLAGFAARLVKYRLTGAFGGIDVGRYREGDPRWESVERSLSRMHALCSERGVAFAVIVYDPSPPIDMVRRLGAERGFPVLEALPERDPRWRERPPQELRNSAVDSHPNAEGCRAYARLIAERLIGAGLLERALGAAAP
jgi:hypothetical protein